MRSLISNRYSLSDGQQFHKYQETEQQPLSQINKHENIATYGVVYSGHGTIGWKTMDCR